MPPSALGLALTLALAAPHGPTAGQGLVPPVPQAGGRFGAAVAASGEGLFVGAPGADGAATQSGAVHVFGQDAGRTWKALATLLPSAGASGDGFGSALAAAGARLAVSSPGVAVFLFERDPAGAWREVQRLAPEDGARQQGFGADLDLSGECLLVGAPGLDQGAGAAWLFERDPATGHFEPRQVVRPGSPQQGAGFGARVALTGRLAAISAPGRRRPDGPAGQASVGAAYLFARGAAGRLGALQLLAPGYPGPVEEYGADLDLDGATAVVGAPGRAVSGLNGAGAALLLEPDGALGTWRAVRELSASNAQADDGFGRAVAVRGDLVLIGAPDTPSGGAVYAFGRDAGGPGAWGELGRVDNPSGFGDFFGAAVDCARDHGVAGAPAADAGTLSSAGAATVIEGLPARPSRR